MLIIRSLSSFALFARAPHSAVCSRYICVVSARDVNIRIRGREAHDESKLLKPETHNDIYIYTAVFGVRVTGTWRWRRGGGGAEGDQRCHVQFLFDMSFISL